MNVVLLHPNAMLPVQTARCGDGYTTTAPISVALEPGGQKRVPLGIATEAPA
ncbi:hypothetical protein EV182_006313, partial [Spiromyces aspiralis]